MSIHGNTSYTYPRSEFVKNDVLSNIYKIRKVLNKTYFQNLIHDIQSELVLVIGEILGIPVQDIKIDDVINIYDIEADISHYDERLKPGLYIASENFSLYFRNTVNGYLIPYNITKIMLDAMNKAETEAVYYCKFNTSKIPVNRMQNTDFKKFSDFMNYYYFLNNQVLLNVDKQGGALFPNMYVAHDPQTNETYIPQVRINTWRIPIFTDAHVNTCAFIRDLDIQIDFMPHPTEDIESADDLRSARFIESEIVQNTQKRRHKYGEDGIIKYYNKNDIHSSVDGAYILLIDPATRFRKDYEKGDNKYNVYTLNKRPNRHMRYLISAYGFATKPNYVGVKETFKAQWLKVNKVYDSEGEAPMSSGFKSIMEYSYDVQKYKFPVISTEGIMPDPEDLTNPQDISVDFEFVQCELENGQNSKLVPVDKYDLGYKTKKTLLGFLVLRSYSGLVGSTLRNGKFDHSDSNDEQSYFEGNDRFTSYGAKTRPHDIFFKVTLRAPKYMNMSGGNFTNVDRPNVNSEITDSSARQVWKFLEDNAINDDDLFAIDTRDRMHRLDMGIKPDKYNESPIYFLQTNHNMTKMPIPEWSGSSEGIYAFVENYKELLSAEVSQNYMWGEYDFYKKKILDKGGYLRPPIQDTIQWQYEMKSIIEYSHQRHGNFLSGYINPTTVAISMYYYYKDTRVKNILKNANVGGINMQMPDPT